MKTSRTCSKCQSSDILRIADAESHRIQTGWTVFGYVPVARYRCGACGFSEQYVEAPEDIETLRRKFGKR